MLASKKASETAGPAVCAATSPVSEKMPAPTVQATPNATSCNVLSVRRSRGPALPNASSANVSIDFRDNTPMGSLQSRQRRMDEPDSLTWRRLARHCCGDYRQIQEAGLEP